MLREILELLTAAGLVTLVALPVGLLSFLLARRFAFPLLPAWRHRWCQWRVIDVILLFGMYVMLPALAGDLLERVGIYRAVFGDDALLDPTSVGAIVGGPGTSLAEAWRYDRIARRTTLAGAVAMPLFAIGFLLLRRLGNTERAVTSRRIPADIAIGVGVWLAVTPLTFLVHFLANLIAKEYGYEPDAHPLKFAKLQTPLQIGLLFLGACVVAPFYEEMIFRRALLPWASGRIARSWGLMAVAALVAWVRMNDRSLFPAPLAFVLIATILMAIIANLRRIWPRFLTRPACAIVSTATLFAAMHSAVWPTPIPLFVLGLGLGWLVSRTRTVTAAVVVHGLFNAISALSLVRNV